jgi:CDP-diglyceride synthetase
LGAVFYTGPIPFLAIAGLLLAIGSQELARLMQLRGYIPVVASLLVWGTFLRMWFSSSAGRASSIQDSVFELILLFFIGVLAAARPRLHEIRALALKIFRPEELPAIPSSPVRAGTFRDVLVAEAASLWISAPLLFVFMAHQAPQENVSEGATFPIWYFASPLLLVLLPLWTGDIAGIFVGMKFGRRPLARALSPKKTVEGSVGNVAGTVLVAAAVGAALQYDLMLSLVCGLLISVCGQAGDLFESALKRKVGLKDSGAILPGHGGVLDRIDSLLFAAAPASLIALHLFRSSH